MSKLSELNEYAHFEGSELGEACVMLLSLYGMRDCLSPSFAIAMNKEITLQLRNFKQQSKIVEEEIVHKEKIRRLEWL